MKTLLVITLASLLVGCNNNKDPNSLELLCFKKGYEKHLVSEGYRPDSELLEIDTKNVEKALDLNPHGIEACKNSEYSGWDAAKRFLEYRQAKTTKTF